MIGWLSDLLGRIPRDALGPPGPHPNEGLEARPDLTTALEMPWDPGHVPKGMHGAELYYGEPADPESGGLSKAWERQNMVLLRDLPGTWNGNPRGKCRLYVHRKMERGLREALRRLDVTGHIDEVRTLGCFTFRRIRHQKTGPLSYHSFGVAIDINADDNFGVMEHKTILSPRNRPVPGPFTDEWYRIWPDGLSRNLVKAFEGVGFEWGGRWSGFVDPMHFQLVRTR